jgi:TonB family protein
VSRTLVVVWAAAMLLTLPARAEKSPQEAADALVEKAQAALAWQELASARRYVDAAIKKVPNHAGAQFLRCSMDIAEADAASRGFVERKAVTEDLKVAADSCGQAAESNQDPARRASVLSLRLRALLMCESWDDAATVFEALIAAAPDDGRLVGGYAAALDRAGRADESRAAMERAATRGPEFDRAARFEFIWDRFDCKDEARLSPMIAALQGEETDLRRRTVLDVLGDALTEHDESALLGFLRLVETHTLNRQELDKLWLTIEGPPKPDQKGLPEAKAELEAKGIQLPVLLRKVAPVYPEIARVIRQTGRVLVLARINVDGSVAPAWIVRATSQLFEQPAIEAVLARRYTPAKRGGEAIPLPFTIRIDFRLR